MNKQTKSQREPAPFGDQDRLCRPRDTFVDASCDVFRWREANSPRFQALQARREALAGAGFPGPAAELFPAYEEALYVWEGAYARAAWAQGVAAAGAAYLGGGAKPAPGPRAVRCPAEEEELKDFYTCVRLALPQDRRKALTEYHAVARQEVRQVFWYAFVGGYEWMLELLRESGLSAEERAPECYYRKLD